MAILNMVGGGGGGLKSTDAILRVIAPAGSTVTISKGTVSKSDQGHENAADNTLYDYYFIVHQSQFDSQNAWTVTATLGINVSSDTVTIDTADEYDVFLLHLVPIEYQAVEYLQSTGTQYIATLAGWQSDIRIVTNFEETSMVGSYPKAFGVEDSSNDGAYKLDIRTGGWRFGYGQTENTFGTYNLNTKYKFESSNNLIYVDDVLKVTCGTSKLPTTSKYLYIFAENSGNSATQFSAIKLYDFNVYYNDVLTFDFAPCYRKSDSVAGLIERVNNVFYTNDGSGSFTVGGNVQ